MSTTFMTYKEECEQLRADLAEREAEIAKLREYLHELACLGNGDIYGNSLGNCLAIEALSAPPSTSYLEQWVADNFGDPVGQYVGESDLGDACVYLYDGAKLKIPMLIYVRKD